MRGRTDGRSGRWVGRAGHNHSEWAFSCPEPARVSPERSRRPDQRGVARRSTEVVVVRQLSVRLQPEVRHVGRGVPSPRALALLVDLGLGHPIVGVILCSWGVGLTDGGAYLRDVVAVTCERGNCESERGVFVNNNRHWTATFNFDQIRSGYIGRERCELQFAS